MRDQINDRKLEHIRLIQGDESVDRDKNYFDAIRLTHRALPEMSFEDVDPSFPFMGRKLSFPLLISSMTGGDHDLVRTINRNLATAAEATGVAMAVGSQRVMFSNAEAKKSFALRKYAPTTLLFANLGAVQLNYGFSAEECNAAIKVVGADGLYLHLNPLQEVVQPEGNTNFTNLAYQIGELTQMLDKPIILKEVGAGISKEDVNLVVERGVRYVDVAGSGGTSWSRIENHRKEKAEDGLGLLFQDWGIPTPLALQELSTYWDDVTLIASGGVRTGIDMAKAVILGASLCGMARPFLKPATESPEAVIVTIERIKREFMTAMFLLGMRTVDRMLGNTSLILR
ncbi:MAG: type 2 isopentenyl-diphosphate Delta-isomerase [Verrucomicrobia bacterium]|nr:type 2 isopentenyl-diphosphate Delta-isomerase [Verrucomicrobiota bacterium]